MIHFRLLKNNLMTGRRRFFACGAILLTAALCTLAPPAAHGAETVDRIVAVVNDEVITLYELNRVLNVYEQRIEAMGYDAEKERQMLYNLREEILNQLIDQKLTDQEIKKLNISVSDQEIDEAVERIKKTSYLTEEGLSEALTRQGLTMSEYREQIKDRILRTKLVNREIKSRVVITKEDVKAYYDSHPEYTGETKYHLRHIIMRVPMFATEEDKLEIKEKMKKIIAELKEGASFAKLAAKYSESPLASEGGDLGFFKMEELSPQLQAAVEGLKDGEFTSVLDTDQGYQIFYIEGVVRSEGKTLEEAAPEIEDILYKDLADKKFRIWIENLRKESYVKIIR